MRKLPVKGKYGHLLGVSGHTGRVLRAITKPNKKSNTNYIEIRAVGCGSECTLMRAIGDSADQRGSLMATRNGVYWQASTG